MYHTAIVRKLMQVPLRNFRHVEQATSGMVETRQFGFLTFWLTKIFNSVDQKRLKAVGPDLACAEWLLRNGAQVRFKHSQAFISDYNELIHLQDQMSDCRKYKVQEIFAEDAGLCSDGFIHLNNCTDVRKITLILCKHVDNDCMRYLNFVKNSLEHLEINSCFMVMDKGVLSLKNLTNLKKLVLVNLAGVKGMTDCEKVLRSSLTNCDIDIRQ